MGMRTLPLLLGAALAAIPLPAQEWLAVDFAGVAYGVDPSTCAVRTIGPTGATDLNAMAQLDGVYYVTGRLGGQRHVMRIDPLTAQVSAFLPTTHDFRGLAGKPGTNFLFGIAQAVPDVLVRIDVQSGAITTIGSTGINGLQSLTHTGTQLLGFDLTLGLVRLSETTGAATDVNASIDSQGAMVQWLGNVGNTVRGGNTEFFQILAGGAVGVPCPGAAPLPDLRGAELRPGLATSFGSGCNTTNGSPAQFVLDGPLVAGSTLTARSSTHATPSLGILVVGLSRTSSGGVPLPIALDPLLGTSGCSLHVSPDLLLPGVTNAQGRWQVPLGLPNVPGAELHLQGACLEPVAGGLSTSQGVTVRMPN